MSDVKLSLTQSQYELLLALSQSIPRVFFVPPEMSESPNPIPMEDAASSSTASATVVTDLQPEPRASANSTGVSAWPSVDLFLAINAVKLQLYDSQATHASDLKDHGIAKFALTDNSLRAKILSDGTLEAQIIMKAFTMSNTRPGNSKFREIIPAAQHNRNQVMILYTASGGTDRSSLAVATVDSPHIIFAIEPVIALIEFFSSVAGVTPPEDAVGQSDDVTTPYVSSSFAFRFDLHNASISILENDSDPDTQAIQLSVNEVLLSQQVSYQV